MVTTWGEGVGKGALRPVDYPLLTDGRQPVQPAWLVSAVFTRRDSAGVQIFYKRASIIDTARDSHFRGSAGISCRLTVTCIADFAAAATNFTLFEVLVLNPWYVTIEDATLLYITYWKLQQLLLCGKYILSLRCIMKEYHPLYFPLLVFSLLFVFIVFIVIAIVSQVLKMFFFLIIYYSSFAHWKCNY